MKINISIETAKALSLIHEDNVTLCVDPINGEIEVIVNFIDETSVNPCRGYFVHDGSLLLTLPSGACALVDGDDVPEHCRGAVAWIVEVATS